ncbi:MAG: ABC transporter ATP-binding protein [Acidimicrobiia bacterium]
MTAIEVKGLVKRYGSLTAVAGIDLEVESGEVLALLGPNGAGKTTTVEVLEGYRERDQGDVSVLGFDPGRDDRNFRERIGIVLQETRLEEQLTPRELFDVYGASYPKHLETDHVLEIVGLTGKADDRIKTLSGGQRRRVQLGLGLVGDPELIFLDEPTTGFDPSARRQAWEVITNLRSMGKTVLLTTHYMDEAQHLADRVTVISGGKVVAEGTPESLTTGMATESNIRLVLRDGASPPLAGRRSGDVFEASSSDLARDLHQLTQWALDTNVDLHTLTVTRPTLEDVYLELTAGSDNHDN